MAKEFAWWCRKTAIQCKEPHLGGSSSNMLSVQLHCWGFCFFLPLKAQETNLQKVVLKCNLLPVPTNTNSSVTGIFILPSHSNFTSAGKLKLHKVPFSYNLILHAQRAHYRLFCHLYVYSYIRFFCLSTFSSLEHPISLPFAPPHQIFRGSQHIRCHPTNNSCSNLKQQWFYKYLDIQEWTCLELQCNDEAGGTPEKETNTWWPEVTVKQSTATCSFTFQAARTALRQHWLLNTWR